MAHFQLVNLLLSSVILCLLSLSYAKTNSYYLMAVLFPSVTLATALDHRWLINLSRFLVQESILLTLYASRMSTCPLTGLQQNSALVTVLLATFFVVMSFRAQEEGSRQCFA